MEIIILMSWGIWKCRNGWIFENTPNNSKMQKFISSRAEMVAMQSKVFLATKPLHMDELSSVVIILFYLFSLFSSLPCI
jgi:hypothetical protein